jgi:eukaryotic-like serine/threonine-protein kinase
MGGMQSQAKRIGKYQLIAELARGGMGVVYLAMSQGPGRFNKILVVKELRPDLTDDPRFLEMFLEEARLAARLSHPNIVQTNEVGEDESRHYMVMDYLDGVALSRLARKQSPRFTIGHKLLVVSQALAGLHYAHTLESFDGTAVGVVHRDATPQNIFLTVDGQVKVVDFGVAKAADSEMETRAGVMKGKPMYMAPEQLRGNADLRSDIFSMGIVLWELLAGTRLWGKRPEIEVLGSLLEGKIPTLPTNLNLDPALIAVVERALQPLPHDRFASAEDFKRAIEEHLTRMQNKDSLGDLGRVISELFREERSRTKTAINAAIESLQSGHIPESLPKISESPQSRTPSGVVERSEASQTGSGVLPLTQAPAGAGHDQTLASAQKRKTLALVAVGGAAVLLGSLVAVMLATRKPTGALRESSEPTSASLALATSETFAHGTAAITLYLVTSPANVELLVDEKKYQGNTSFQCLPGQHIRVRASAPGHVSLERDHVCASSTELVFALTPSKSQPAAVVNWALVKTKNVPPSTAQTGHTAPTSATTAPAIAATAQAKSDINPAGGKAPLRPVDPDNPYNAQ